MKSFTFVRASLPAPRNMVDTLETRFTKFLTAYRKRHAAQRSPFEALALDKDFDGEVTCPDWDEPPPNSRLTEAHLAMITKRARRVVAHINARTDCAHLVDDQIKRLLPASQGMRLVPLRDAQAPDEIAGALHDEFPWLAPATDAVWQALRLSVGRGTEGVRIPPLLLVGPPGIGKTTWARKLGSLIGVPTGIIEATSEPSSFALVGTQKGWGSAASGKPLDLILRTMVANPVFVVDEIEKAGRTMSQSSGAYDMTSGLLSLLERESSQSWQCPYFQLPFDMSWISWILTANDASRLPAPLRSRVTIIDLPALTIAQVIDFTMKEGARRNLSAPSLDAAMIALQRAATCQTAPSLRTALRALERAEAMEARPMLH
ncbi:AAA family ATPase [Loktanella sp. M215]|uniref:AAA family ATPase n=1 Tax=Loktanella sp. M215 TaxID=2675431 RepID=UPI001F0164F1|nr:AAA family ATPase [Loktanella sp. M215]